MALAAAVLAPKRPFCSTKPCPVMFIRAVLPLFTTVTSYIERARGFAFAPPSADPVDFGCGGTFGGLLGFLGFLGAGGGWACACASTPFFFYLS